MHNLGPSVPLTRNHVDEFPFFRLPDRSSWDFSKHNEEVNALWAAFNKNHHPRAPVQLITNPRMLMLDPTYHRQAPSYKDYMTDPEVMGEVVLEWLYWMRFLLPGDHEQGLPESWQVHIDFQNFYDAASLGGVAEFEENQIPYATPLLNDDNKRMLFDIGIPDPFKGEWAERALAFFDYFEKKHAAGWAFLGKPVETNKLLPFMGTDGPFTTAAALRGATNLCMDILLEPSYVHELLDFITEAIITRMKAWRREFNQPEELQEWLTADDSIEMLSIEQYREFVLPRHRTLYDAFCPKGKRGIHLCGNAQHLFPLLKAELNITTFDTGFPIDFALFRREMGPAVLLLGGPRAPLFIEDDIEPLLKETERILTSGVLDGGRFILREGNNLPPCTPLRFCEAFYNFAIELQSKLGLVR